jgi:hypothetical protein
VLRLTATTGLITVGRAPAACMCSTRQFWTADAGRSWHETTAVGDDFTGTGKTVYWWNAGDLDAIAGFPREAMRSNDVLRVTNGTVVDAAPVPGGIAALVSSRRNGLGWDTSPRVAIIRNGRTQIVTLPPQTGDILAQRLAVRWPRLAVVGTDFDPTPAKPVSWLSADGGATWSDG